MKCLRCGYCCIKYLVVIVDDPEKGPVEDNLKCNEGVRCQHLIGDEPGKFSCAIHEKIWYNETPCYEHTQVEQYNSPCRIGEGLMKKDLNEVRKILGLDVR
jgi:hypothetical protein